MKTLLLTGGTGYIGSHNAVLFLQEGYEVIILDNLSNSNEETIKSIQKITGKVPKFYKGDIRSLSDIESVFLENTIDCVIHFAGAKAVGESCDIPFYYYENNITGSLNLFKVMEKYNSKNIIFSSSANVYGPGGQSPFTEMHSIGDTSNPYGTTKFILERLLRDLHLHSGFNVINLRYFNPVGAHASGLIGEHANQKLGNILPFLLKVANNEQEYIEVYGNDYDTPDGTGIRDYIHVVDLAYGHLSALRYLEENTSVYQNINLGTGQGTSVMELLELVRKVTNHPVPHRVVARRSIDMSVAYCSTKKAAETLGWKAEKTVEQAVTDSWNFIKNKPGK